MQIEQNSKFNEDAFKEVNGDSFETDEDDFDIDAIIEKLLSVRSKVPGPACMVDLEVETILKIIEKA
jgi:hypothetical protein